MNVLKRILLSVLPFLRGRPPLEQEHIERVLLIGCASRLNITRAIAAMHGRFPRAKLVLLLPRAAASARIPGRDSVDAVVEYPGLRQARRDAAGYDLKVVLFTGEGQWLFKLQSFLLPARRMLVFTEGGGMFSWSFDQRLAIWNHLQWRISGGRPLVELLGRLLRALVRLILSGVAFIVLLLWHLHLLVRRSLAHLRRG